MRDPCAAAACRRPFEQEGQLDGVLLSAQRLSKIEPKKYGSYHEFCGISAKKPYRPLITV
jgi:hypothetical protein